MSIYTRRGDGGETSLVDGSRIRKDDPRVEAYGTVDEANCLVGTARALTEDPTLDAVLGFMQQRLFNCSSRLATPPGSRSDATPAIATEDVEFLERAIDAFEARTGPMRAFVLPGGTQLSAALHVARSVVRRAERCVVTLGPASDGDELVARFLNRSSDALFAAARYALAIEGVDAHTWDVAAEPPTLDVAE